MTGRRVARRPRQNAPGIRRAPGFGTDEQQLDTSAGGPSDFETRRTHTGLVEHERVPGTEPARQLGDNAVRELGCRAIDDEEPSVLAPRGRVLGDALGRKLVVEVFDPQRGTRRQGSGSSG